MVRLLAALAVLAHAVVVLLHGGAHAELRVALSVWQKNFVAIVILVAPLAAAVLLWTRYIRLGVLLLIASMAGSLFFGLYYVLVSADNVWYLPPGDAQGLFRLTVLLLAARGVWPGGGAVGPKFTNQVQHFLYKVLQWDDAMNSFRLKSAVHFPDLSKPGKQSAKSRQLWIARHRL